MLFNFFPLFYIYMYICSDSFALLYRWDFLFTMCCMNHGTDYSILWGCVCQRWWRCLSLVVPIDLQCLWSLVSLWWIKIGFPFLCISFPSLLLRVDGITSAFFVCNVELCQCQLQSLRDHWYLVWNLKFSLVMDLLWRRGVRCYCT